MNLFFVSRREKDGYTPECKPCRTDYIKIQSNPDILASEIQAWHHRNRLLLKRCISTMHLHEFITECNKKLVVDFRNDKHDISLYDESGELVYTYRFVNTDQTRAIKRMIQILHDQEVKVIGYYPANKA